MADEEPLVKVSTEGPVSVLTLNRPKAKNAINNEMIRLLAEALERNDADEAIRVNILTGGPDFFAAGADIKEAANVGAFDPVNEGRMKLWSRIRTTQKPVVAAVSGFALGGGCELVMACDVVIASESAQFGQPEVNLGIIPGAGGTQRLPRAVGKFNAMYLCLTGDFIPAVEAKTMGLVQKVVPVDKLMEEALAVAKRIASKAPLAVRYAKQAILKAQDVDLESGLEYERKAFILLTASEDRKEGFAAFMEKRPATFKGR